MQRISQLEFSYQKICLDFLLKTFVFVIFFSFIDLSLTTQLVFFSKFSSYGSEIELLNNSKS